MSVDDVTDRDRLAFAFDDLTKLGYYAPVMYSWNTCCARCAHEALRADVGNVDDLKGYVFWHAQKDLLAFYPDMVAQLPKMVYDMLARGEIEESELEGWITENFAATEAAALDERITLYSTLIRPLYLHWNGDPEVICLALRARGLTVHDPVAADRCISVWPQRG